MLITDGAPEYFDELWATRNQHAATRVFTYLVGREVTDYREVKWMACANKGEKIMCCISFNNYIFIS